MGKPSRHRRDGREAFEQGKSRTEGPGRYGWGPSRGPDDIDPDWLEGWDAAAADAQEAARRQRDEEARYRYMPASYKAKDKLAEVVGEAQAELVKDLITTMIYEAMNPEQE